MARITDNDYAAFKNGVCIAIASVLEGKGADRHEREFYADNRGCEIRIMPRSEACDALRSGLKRDFAKVATL